MVCGGDSDYDSLNDDLSLYGDGWESRVCDSCVVVPASIILNMVSNGLVLGGVVWVVGSVEEEVGYVEVR